MWQQVAFKLLKNYAKHLGLQGVLEEDEENENEQEMVPSFAETYEALQKVKAFFYVQSGSDADHENIFKSWKVIFSIEAKFRQETKDNVRLFLLKSSFLM